MPDQIHLRITGMTCAGCASRVESALRNVPGAADAAVNLLAESATVSIENSASPTALVEAVRSAGYDAQVVTGGRPMLDRLASGTELRETLRRHRQGLIQVIGLALPIMALDHLMHILWGHTFEKQVTARYMQFILLVMLCVSPGAAPILAGGLRAALLRTGNMDLLITMGVLAALLSSIYGVFIAKDPSFIHIDAAAMILGFVCIGRYLETRAKARAAAAMTALAKRAPREALVRANGEWLRRPVERIAVGDVIAVPELEPIPVDGEIIEGEASIDESLMTGEPMPVRRTPGDAVLGGTMVVEGRIVLRATATGAKSAMGRIIELVQNAQTGRTNAQRMADRVAAVFVPIVLMAAALTFAGWLVWGGAAAASTAARAAAAVLVVACPCALGLATPTVVTAATGAAALRGILVRDAATLETAGRITRVLWDKTGTLTAGSPAVVDMATLDHDGSLPKGATPRLAQSQRGGENADTTRSGEVGIDEREVLRLAASAEQFSSHPIAKAIVAEARRHGMELPEATEYRVMPGRGVEARVEGRLVFAGKSNAAEMSGARNSIDYSHPSHSSRPSPFDGAGADARFDRQTHEHDNPHDATSIVTVWIDGQAAGQFRLMDTVRPSSRAAIQRLSRLGVRSEMITGDRRAAALAVAKELGIDKDSVAANMSPAEKLERVRSTASKSLQVVAMVGDGVNDAGALAAADVGIAFATGAQLACDAAGIQLIGSTPLLVADAVELARASGRIIRQNLFWAFFYNVLMIPLAAAGLLPPMAAAAAMMVSSLTVVLNALRLPRMFEKTRSR